MTGSPSIIVLPGAGGGAPNPAIFTADMDDLVRVQTIAYPGWQRYVAHDFSAEVLIGDLASQIASRIPEGPIHIVGISIGGHFGYAAALRLQAAGREIAGFCAIDTFMIASAAPSAGWQGRALGRLIQLARKGRFGDLVRFARSLLWRALLRLARDRLPNLLLKFTSGQRLPSLAALDPAFEHELSMRLLIRATAPWIALLDSEPAPLKVPAMLIRTRRAATDDIAWRHRCPYIEIFEVPGEHHTLFELENVGPLRAAFATGTGHWHARNSKPEL
jgi:thioesterase domain-containing protein